jgi:DmsE family decaheme c-type cytochrome
MANVTCDTCHKTHANKDKIVSKAAQAEVCYTCHKEQRAQVNKPSHHPIPEGKMTCSDCHNVHGSTGPKLAKRDTFTETCYTCHAEKRGPFVQQHSPVADDCSNCHNSHGSVIAGMLKARAPMLCQQCHTPHIAGSIGAVGGQAGVFGRPATGQSIPQITSMSNGKNVINMWQGRSCMNCHTQVHGSNSPSITNPLMR